MPFVEATRNLLLDELDTLAPYASVHTADPGATGAAEAAGGSYTRQAITWSAAAAGSKTFTASVQMQIPAGTTITHGGLWSAVSGGNWRGGEELDAPQSYPTGGVYDLTFTVTAA